MHLNKQILNIRRYVKYLLIRLDKSDRKEGLLKKLKNIEDRNNNQLLAIKNIPRTAKKVKIMMMLIMNKKQFKIIIKN